MIFTEVLLQGALILTASLIFIPVLQMQNLRHSEMKAIQQVNYRARIQTL